MTKENSLEMIGIPKGQKLCQLPYIPEVSTYSSCRLVLIIIKSQNTESFNGIVPKRTCASLITRLKSPNPVSQPPPQSNPVLLPLLATVMFPLTQAADPHSVWLDRHVPPGISRY